MKRRVVITGLGIVSALGSKLDECWRRLVAAESGIRPLTLFNTSDLKVTFGGEVSGFDPTGYTYRSIGGAKRAIAAQIRSGMYGSEQWDFVIDETTYTGNGASFVEVCTYERQSQQVTA